MEEPYVNVRPHNGRASAKDGYDGESKPSLVSIPFEIISNIFTHIRPLDLNAIGRTCRCLRRSSNDDLLWKPFVLENLPAGIVLSSPSPCESFRELYWSLDPHWFIAKRRVFFSDFPHRGELILTRFNSTTGHIEGFKVSARKTNGIWDIEIWERNPDAHLCRFDPVVKIGRDIKVISIPCKARFDAAAVVTPLEDIPAGPRNTANYRTRGKIAMPGTENQESGYSALFCLLSKSPENDQGPRNWPPATVPAPSRTLNSNSSLADATFRVIERHIREESTQEARWLFPFTGTWSHYWEENEGFAARSGNSPIIREVNRYYGAIDLEDFTPTDEYPFRGIWVGDYSAHGCEFLLLKQEGNAQSLQRSPPPIRKEDETESEFKARLWEHTLARVSGKLEAVKITGDPNIPRGEISFFANDLSDSCSEGVVGINEFQSLREKGEVHGEGRLVKSVGHIAADGFRNDKYIDTQVILLSPDLIGQYWIPFDQISLYRRVDIDKLTTELYE